MEIKVIRVYLTGSKRIHELYEEKQQALLKQEELRRAVRAQDRQMKGYGRDFEQMLREKELLRAEIGKIKEIYDEVLSERDEWEHRYRESEKARKSLGDKNRALRDDLDKMTGERAKLRIELERLRELHDALLKEHDALQEEHEKLVRGLTDKEAAEV